MSSCSICCVNFTTKKRIPVECPNPECDVVACMECSKRYMLESSELPHCMGCRGEFNSLWLTNNGFPKTFINGQLKKHIANVLFQKERAKMPETQERVAVLARS